jgi:hypothetical protein
MSFGWLPLLPRTDAMLDYRELVAKDSPLSQLLATSPVPLKSAGTVVERAGVARCNEALRIWALEGNVAALRFLASAEVCRSCRLTTCVTTSLTHSAVIQKRGQTIVLAVSRAAFLHAPSHNVAPIAFRTPSPVQLATSLEALFERSYATYGGSPLTTTQPRCKQPRNRTSQVPPSPEARL